MFFLLKVPKIRASPLHKFFPHLFFSIKLSFTLLPYLLMFLFRLLRGSPAVALEIDPWFECCALFFRRFSFVACAKPALPRLQSTVSDISPFVSPDICAFPRKD